MNPPAGPESVARSSRTSEASVMSSVSVPDASSANLPPAGMGMVAMSGTPDMGPWRNFLNFMYYSPISFWTITGSLFLIGAYSLIEFLYLRKKNKTRWTADNPEYSVGPDIQKPLP